MSSFIFGYFLLFVIIICVPVASFLFSVFYCCWSLQVWWEYGSGRRPRCKIITWSDGHHWG